MAKIAKYRKAGWIAACVMLALLVVMIVVVLIWGGDNGAAGDVPEITKSPDLGMLE